MLCFALINSKDLGSGMARLGCWLTGTFTFILLEMHIPIHTLRIAATMFCALGMQMIV